MHKKLVIKVLSILCLSSSCALAETVNICDDGAEFPPYAYYEKQSNQLAIVKPPKVIGATKELLTEIFSLIDLEYNLELLPWKRCLLEVEHFGINQRYEMFSNGSYSKERSNKYLVSVPIYKTHEGLWYSKKRSSLKVPIKKAAELNNYKLCGVLGYNYDWLEGMGITKAINTGAKDVKSALLMISKGRCDFYIGGLENTYGGATVGLYPLPEDIVGIPFPEARTPSFHLYISKSSPRANELHTNINQAILLLQKQGIAQKIYRKYLPEGDGL